MLFPENLLELPAEEAARLIALAQVEELRDARDRLAIPGDPEALHDFRVALRRLRTTLRVFWRQLDELVTDEPEYTNYRLAR
jgi:CHAD domain-containing protein